MARLYLETHDLLSLLVVLVLASGFIELPLELRVGEYVIRYLNHRSRLVHEGVLVEHSG